MHCTQKAGLVLVLVLADDTDTLLGQPDRDMAGERLDTLGIEPRASRMLSGCDTTTPRALDHIARMSILHRWKGGRGQHETRQTKVDNRDVWGLARLPAVCPWPRAFQEGLSCRQLVHFVTKTQRNHTVLCSSLRSSPAASVV